MKHIVILFLLVSFFNCQNIKGQYRLDHHPRKKGLQIQDIGFFTGVNIIGEKLPEGAIYKPTLLLGNITFNLYHNLSAKRKKLLLLSVESQFNMAETWSSDLHTQQNDRGQVKVNNVSNIEFGMNICLRYDYELLKDQFVYAMVGTGPHFVSLKTTIQVQGFIFSDNFAVGTYRDFGKFKLNLQCRFRHMSNASLQHPNKGIDGLFILGGVSLPLAMIVR